MKLVKARSNTEMTDGKNITDFYGHGIQKQSSWLNCLSLHRDNAYKQSE